MNKPRVLYVDDEQINLINFKYAYEEDFMPLVAADADEALALCAARMVDIVLTDQRMPGMSGVELCGIIAKSDYRVPTVIVTGYVENEEIEAARRAGIVAEVVTKPYTRATLLETVRRHTSVKG